MFSLAFDQRFGKADILIIKLLAAWNKKRAERMSLNIPYVSVRYSLYILRYTYRNVFEMTDRCFLQGC